MNIRAYEGKQLQNFISLLNQAESEGITDLIVLRKRVQDGIHLMLLEHRKENPREAYSVSARHLRAIENKKIAEICPSCGKKTLLPVPMLEGFQRVGCKCGYTRMV